MIEHERRLQESIEGAKLANVTVFPWCQLRYLRVRRDERNVAPRIGGVRHPLQKIFGSKRRKQTIADEVAIANEGGLLEQQRVDRGPRCPNGSGEDGGA